MIPKHKFSLGSDAPSDHEAIFLHTYAGVDFFQTIDNGSPIVEIMINWGPHSNECSFVTADYVNRYDMMSHGCPNVDEVVEHAYHLIPILSPK